MVATALRKAGWVVTSATCWPSMNTVRPSRRRADVLGAGLDFAHAEAPTKAAGSGGGHDAIDLRAVIGCFPGSPGETGAMLNLLTDIAGNLGRPCDRPRSGLGA